MNAQLRLFRNCGFRSVFLIIISAFLLRLATGNGDEDVKKIAVNNGEEVSEEGGGAYDKKPETERHNCSFFYDDRYPTNEGGLVNCSWYAQKSCCKRTEVTSVFAAMDPLYGATKLCANYINFLMCYFCSPDQYKFFKKSSTRAMVCLEYCESLYEECKTAGLNKILIGEAYSNGTAFCSAQNFDVTENADCFNYDPTVLGNSHRFLPSFVQVLLVIVAVYISRCQICV